MNVLLINGHPRVNSFSDALADAYAEGISETNNELQRLNVRDLSFDFNVRRPVGQHQSTEPDIAKARELIGWADHIVFVYPIWWGTAPAILKGFIDRVFASEFAFLEIDGGTGYAPLLSGKTAQLIFTMDTPYLIYKWIYGDPGNKTMGRSLLRFCGFRMTPTLHFGPIKSSSAAIREKWIAKVRNAAANLRSPVLPIARRVRITLTHWLKAIRLQFYPMTFLAYLLGSKAAELGGLSFNQNIFWTGYIWIFFLEVATVLSNDYFDFETDSANKYYSPFTGGSRVLVDKSIPRNRLRNAIILCTGVALAALVSVLLNSVGSSIEILLASGLLFLLAIGYTVPPLKLAYRGLGEITVSLTHSFAVIIAGYLFQGGKIVDPYPWVLGIPLFLSVFPSITLAGVPDREADQSANKRTIAVRLGKRSAIKIALLFTWLAVVSVLLIQQFYSGSRSYQYLLWFAIPHAILVSYYLLRFLNLKQLPHRIDPLMIVTLTYIIWFVVIPLVTIAE